MVDTETIFWSNFEGGLCLIAVNLPSLNALRGDLSAPAEQFVTELRTKLSLHSLNSAERERGPATGGVVVVNNDSQVPIREMGRAEAYEWYRLRELNSRDGGREDGSMEAGRRFKEMV